MNISPKTKNLLTLLVVSISKHFKLIITMRKILLFLGLILTVLSVSAREISTFISVLVNRIWKAMPGSSHKTHAM